MEAIASVNGVKVYSNKSLSRISEDKVEFIDGSLCNVKTGMIQNRRRGFISLDAPPVEASVITESTGAIPFNGHSVSISNADVAIGSSRNNNRPSHHLTVFIHLPRKY
jgi:hypothetical protein